MRIVIKNIKNLYVYERGMFRSLLIVPFFVVLLTLISVGIIVDYSMTSEEQSREMQTAISLQEPCDYETAIEVVKNVYGKLGENVFSNFGLMGFSLFTGQMKLGLERYNMPVTMYGRLKDGELLPYESKDFAKLQEGKAWDDELYSSETPYGISLNIMENSVNIQENKVLLIGKRYDTKGEENAFPWINVNPAGIKNVPIRTIVFELNRSLFSSEYESFCQEMDRGGIAYEVLYKGESTADIKAMKRTIIMVCGLFVVCLLYILWILYGHILRMRTYEMSVFRLLGCKRRKAILLTVSEVIMVFSIPGLMGFAVFEVMQQKLATEYQYLLAAETQRILYSICGAIALFVLLESVVLAIVFTGKTVRQKMVND